MKRKVLQYTELKITLISSFAVRAHKTATNLKGCDVLSRVSCRTKRTNPIWFCMWFGDTQFAIFPWWYHIFVSGRTKRTDLVWFCIWFGDTKYLYRSLPRQFGRPHCGNGQWPRVTRKTAGTAAVHRVCNVPSGILKPFDSPCSFMAAKNIGACRVKLHTAFFFWHGEIPSPSRRSSICFELSASLSLLRFFFFSKWTMSKKKQNDWNNASLQLFSFVLNLIYHQSREIEKLQQRQRSYQFSLAISTELKYPKGHQTHYCELWMWLCFCPSSMTRVLYSRDNQFAPVKVSKQVGRLPSVIHVTCTTC